MQNKKLLYINRITSNWNRVCVYLEYMLFLILTLYQPGNNKRRL